MGIWWFRLKLAALKHFSDPVCAEEGQSAAKARLEALWCSASVLRDTTSLRSAAPQDKRRWGKERLARKLKPTTPPNAQPDPR
jgi:hypothetical protein